MTRYALTPTARADLQEIDDYLRGKSSSAARLVRSKLRDAMPRLSQRPGLGHLRDDLADEPLRFWPVYSNLIVYRAELRPIQVVRVLHGARDVRQILTEP